MDWFSDWFDSKYYHILYTDRDNAEAEHFISNILDFLNPKKEQHILDLACGKGRHSKLLNDLGYRVTGVDLSENSITFQVQTKLARNELLSLLKKNKTIYFIEQQKNALSFSLLS